MIIIPILFSIIGIITAIFALHSNHHWIRKYRLMCGGMSVLGLLIVGMMIIQHTYAKEIPAKRIFQKHLEKNYPDRSLDLS